MLIPKDSVGPGAVELGVPQYIDRQMQTPYGDASRWYMQGPFLPAEAEFGYQSKLTPKEQYRLGIRAINAYCREHFGGKAFAELTHAQQTDFFKQIESGALKVEGFKLKTFFEGFLLVNVNEGVFLRSVVWRKQGHGRLENDRLPRRARRLPGVRGRGQALSLCTGQLVRQTRIRMAVIKKKPVDAVIVGFGWTGSIMAIELANAGLNVVALERGDARDTVPSFAYPQIVDEIKYSARQALLQNLAKTTVTIGTRRTIRRCLIGRSVRSSRARASAERARIGRACSRA